LLIAEPAEAALGSLSGHSKSGQRSACPPYLRAATLQLVADARTAPLAARLPPVELLAQLIGPPSWPVAAAECSAVVRVSAAAGTVSFRRPPSASAP
jgi:hypothetical protein